MEKVFVEPELLRWARERSGVPAETLSGKFPKLKSWEAKEDAPTMRKLEEFARATFTPLGYLFLKKPPGDTLPIPDYRTTKSNKPHRPSPNLLETIRMMQRRQAWMKDLLTDEGEKPLTFVGSVKISDDPVDVASRIKQELKLSDTWAQQFTKWVDALSQLRTFVENIGVFVVSNGVVGNNTHRKLAVDEFRGFVLIDKYSPLIFVNSADAKAAQMFTVAHELAHVWLGTDGVFNLRGMQPADNDIERFCDRVAAEFLVPAKIFSAEWDRYKSERDPFQAFAYQFKVSPLVIARRALDLKKITRDDFFRFYENYLEQEYQGAKSTGGGDFYATQSMRIGRRFGEYVIRAAKEGRLLYRDAYQLTGLRGSTFDKYAQRLGM